MLLLCRSRWPWLVNGHLVMLYVPNSHQVGHLPLSHPKDGGQLYLANMGIPKNVYKEVIFWTLGICPEFILFQVGIKFASPFGAKFVIALHQPRSTM